MDEYESILLVKPEVFVFNIPPRATNRSYRYENIIFIYTHIIVYHYVTYPEFFFFYLL